jgi:hypothetical protein
VATDSLGITATSAPVTLTITGSIPIYTPGTNLQLWLRADMGVETNSDGTVNTWLDQSGQSNNAVQGAQGNPPLLLANAVNGKPSIQLNGTNGEYLQVANSPSLEITGDIASLVVVQQPPDTDYRMVWFQGGTHGYPSPNGLMLAAGDPTPNRGTGANETQDVYYGTVNVQPNQYALIAFSQAGTNMTQFLNGIPNGTQSSTITPFDGDGDSLLYIGTRADFYDIYTSDLQIAELMIFNTALTGTNLTDVENYLGSKYGFAVASQVDAGPAVSIVTPTNGSSLTAPANFDVSAAVTASTGTTISTVQLLVNGLSFGTLSGPPYHWTVYVSTPGTVALAVTATDNHGVANSAIATITLTESNTPAYTAGTNLVLWLRADVGVTTNGSGGVTSWADQSSYGNNAVAGTTPDGGATANPPVLIPDAINGEPGIHFYNSTVAVEYFQVPDSTNLAITGDIASLLVCKYPDLDSYYCVWTEGGSSGYPSPNGLLFATGGQPLFYRGNGQNSQDLFYGNVAVQSGQYSLLTFSQAGTTMTQYLNGVPNGTSTATQMPYADTDNEPMYIGTRGDFYYLTMGFDLEVAEFMIFNTALTGTNLTTVENYLGAKYGLTLIEPGQFPSLTIALHGNSILILWPPTYNGYILQSASRLSGSWAPVAGVQNNQVTITP